VTGKDTGDKTVHLGKEWHKACFETAFPTKAPKEGLGPQMDRCPGCQQSMMVGANTGDKTIVAGREWHTDCFRKAKDTCAKCGHPLGGKAFCGECGTRVAK